MLEHSYMFVLMTITVMTFVLAYVNDIIVTRSSEPFIQSLIHRLNKHFVLKDLRDLSYFWEFKSTYPPHLFIFLSKLLLQICFI